MGDMQHQQVAAAGLHGVALACCADLRRSQVDHRLPPQKVCVRGDAGFAKSGGIACIEAAWWTTEGVDTGACSCHRHLRQRRRWRTLLRCLA